MTKTLTVEQAIELLQTSDRCNWGEPAMWVKMTDYHALLALLEGLRWRRVSEEKPPQVPVMVQCSVGIVLGSLNGTVWHVEADDEYEFIDAESDDLWMPLPPPPSPPANQETTA